MIYRRRNAIVRSLCCALLALAVSLSWSAAGPGRVGATEVTPGMDIGSADGDRDGDGIVEGPVSGEKSGAEELASDIGDSISRGMESVREGAEELASGMMGGEATEEKGRGPVETDPGAVKDGDAKTAGIEELAAADRATADTVWVIISVIAAVAVISAIVIAVPKKDGKKEKTDRGA